MSYKKQQVESTLKKAISDVVSRRLSDPRIVGLVSVTRVDVSPDGLNAKVYISVLPEKHSSKSLHGLRHAAGRIYLLMRKSVSMRKVPRLTFHLDETLKREATVLDAIHRGIDQDGVGAVPGSIGLGSGGTGLDRLVNSSKDPRT